MKTTTISMRTLRNRPSLSPTTRLRLEPLEDRTLLSNGQWIAHFNDLPGPTRQVQIQAARELLEHRPVTVVDHFGADGLLLIQADPTLDQRHLTAELQRVHGFDYVEAYDSNADPDSRRSYFPISPQQEHDGGSQPQARLGPPPGSGSNGFEGINAAQGGNFHPPDSDGAVGPSSFIQQVNSAIAIYDKTTGTPISGGGITALNSFFAPVVLSGAFTGDPVTVYNDVTGRFGVGADDFINNVLYFAISNTSNPTLASSSWRFFRYDLNDPSGGSNIGDYPKIGYNADGFVISFNQFQFFFDHSAVLAIRNDGTSPGIRAVPGGFTHFTMAPASMHDATPGGPMWFTETPGSAGNSSGNQVTVVGMTNVFTATPTYTYTSIPVNSYLGTGDPHQPGGLISGNANLGTRMYFSALRTVGGVTHLVAANTVGDGSGFSRVRWYDVNVSATPELIQQGQVNPGGSVDTLMPCADISPSGAIGLQYMQSSGSEFVSMYFTGRTASYTAGTMQTPVLVSAGVGNLAPSDRIGDYSFTSVDPVDGSFWGVNEFAGAAGLPNWRTWIQHFNARLPQTVTVTTTADSGIGSLRAALGLVQNGDMITFADNVRGTITLTSGELLLRNGITIAGPGASLLTVSGNHAGRVFEVVLGTSVSLSGLTVTQGTAAIGGGIFNAGTLTLSDASLDSNAATSSTGSGGGGIYNDGTLAVTNSTLSSNSASYAGGGISSSGTLTVTNSTLRSNRAAWGGGLYNNGGTLTVTHSTLDANSATTNNGGGIWNGGTLTVSYSTVSANSATRGNGGGIYSVQGTVTVTNSTLSSNSASYGGGMYNSFLLTVTNSTLNANSASHDGGGIDNSNGGTLMMTNCTISGNRAASHGGGILNNAGSVTVSYSTVSANSANAGGGLFNTSASLALVLQSSIVAGNSSRAHSPSGPDIWGRVDSSSSYNLVGKNDGGLSGISNGVGHNQIGTSASPIDPRLGPLQDNGGPTWTMALLAGSRAFHAGNPIGAPATDQRGVVRTGGVNIGAYQA